FAHVDACPVEGPRIFFENAGGALTLKSVVATSQTYAAIPDNQGRANLGSARLNAVIGKAKADMAQILHAPGGQFFMGESGSELLFRLIMNACLHAGGGHLLGSTLEHPASRSASTRWARVAGMQLQLIPHDDATGHIAPAAYAAHVTPDTRVATIVHTSPVTGMGVDVAGVSAAIRATAPDCLIIVDGIQHAAHGAIDLAAYDVDGYVISPYKMFSRHGFGLAWISDRMQDIEHDALLDGPAQNWELGTRDTGAYATLSDVADYLRWLGAQIDPKDPIRAAGRAILAHEQALIDAMLYGTGNLPGLVDMPSVTIIGGADTPHREGLVSLRLDDMPSADVVHRLNTAGIRTHLRKADHYSGNILTPLGFDACVRVSLCHYNTMAEVGAFLAAMKTITDGGAL
ncbi:MAG: aminotransferase class V-fold PLP-dependent enzyme, partial [Pseudomonadota bacterium]